ncbi:MAG: heat-inducible transcriptional repressor HrcA [Bacillota bacterium]|jgi:heat-inducible transcriptional repressor|nr:heat-inducible transcriptional repressor HrcA [Bacillota bacterium]NLH86841.1 heat-inducible transcription repressor HrcA [Bacillota bacterium]HAN87514.1 heat-inducible transcription repressor HrcA [Bacillota bacterium]
MAETMADRKKAILRAVTDDYISTAEPVGSRTIARKYGLGVSSATIRNEMADLEDEGYLEQPHVSAGRIPSDKGYRFYVDALMPERALTGPEEKTIRAECARRSDEIQSLIRATAKVLGELSNCASVVIGPGVKTAEIRHIQLVPLSSDSVLVLVVTNAGLVEHRVLAIDHEMDPRDLENMSRMLNHRLRGSSLARMRGRVLGEILADLNAYASFLEEMFDLLLSATRSSDQDRVYVDGLMRLLGQPEFNELERARPILEFLESDDLVLTELSGSASRGLGGAYVTIGSENQRQELRECSVVCAPYGVGGQVVGTIAVVGPTRIDYSLVTSLVEYMAESLSDLLARIQSAK